MAAKSKKKRSKPAVGASTPAPSTAQPQLLSREAARSILALAALTLLTLLAFSNSFSAGFILDNKAIILQDPRIRELTSGNIRQILQHTYWWPTAESRLYRPFTTLSYLFNYAVLGNANEPAGYHCINFLLHLGNVFLVYVLVRRLLRAFWVSFFAAALWAVHPVLTESVTNMIGRSDLLAAMAVLSGFLMYLKGTESAGLRRITWLAGMMGVTTVGVFSKESAVTVLGVIALYELTWWKERKQGRALLLGCIATALPIAAMLYQRSKVLAASAPMEFPFTDNPLVGSNFWTARVTAVEVIPRYLERVLWPAKLSVDYSYAQIPLSHGALQDWAACAAVLAVALLVGALYWRHRTAFFLAFFAQMTFLPTSNLLFPIGTIMAERFLYLPSIGLLACVVMAIYAAGEQLQLKRLAPVVLCVITAAFAARTWVRNGDWQDERAMAEASVRTSPNSFKVHSMLAAVLYGKDVVNPDLNRAIQEAERAVEILNPLPDSRNRADVYRLAGALYLAKGDTSPDSPESSAAYKRALPLLQRAISIDRIRRAAYGQLLGFKWDHRRFAIPPAAKSDGETQCMLAVVYSRLGKAHEASAAAAEALALHPLNPEAYRQISDAFFAENRIDDAAVALIEGRLITSDVSLSFNLMDLYRRGLGSSCAITAGPNGPMVNLHCDLVHRQFCAAAVESLKAAIEEDRWDVAMEQKQNFLHKYGCPAGPLEQVLPQ